MKIVLRAVLAAQRAAGRGRRPGGEPPPRDHAEPARRRDRRAARPPARSEQVPRPRAASPPARTAAVTVPAWPAASYETLLYSASDGVATVTLNRPERLNTIVPPMPDEVEAAVGRAVRDHEVKVIVVRGAGRVVLRRLRLRRRASTTGTSGSRATAAGIPGKDFALATAPEIAPTQKFMSVWRAPKPVIAQVHGWCVGGGSDFALCADLVVASEDAVIGTPYSRMWGAYLSGMWIYRLGLDEGQGARPHRAAAHRRRGSRCGPDQPGRAVRRARGHGGGAGGRARARSRRRSWRRRSWW